MKWPRAVALAALLLAALNTSGAIKVEDSTIYLLLIALASLALPEISKLSFGKDGFTFERFQAMTQDIAAIKEGTVAAMENQVGGKLPSPAPRAALHAAAPESKPQRDALARGLETEALAEPSASPAPAKHDTEVDPGAIDPQAGRWGGHEKANGRRVYAKVTQSPLRPDWFDVAITVESTDPKRPLLGDVVFHLHPTFDSPRRRPVIEGRAKINLVAWGAFTVGVETDGGRTPLEINLADVPDAPPAFRQR